MKAEEYAHVILIKISSCGKELTDTAVKQLKSDEDYKKGIILLTDALKGFAEGKIVADRKNILQRTNDIWGPESSSAKYIKQMIAETKISIA